MKNLLTFIFSTLLAGSIYGQTWETDGSNMYLTPASAKLAIGTSTIGNESISLNCPTVLDPNSAVLGIRAIGSSFGEYYSGDTEGRLVSNSNWNSQAQGFGVMGNLTLRRSGGSQNSVSAGGLFNLTMTSMYSTYGSGMAYSGAVISRLRGAVAELPSNNIITASLISLDEIKSSGTYAGFFDGRTYFRDNVGIGNKNPLYKLDVAGTIRSTEILVEAQSADFVFEDSYNLRELNEVAEFIRNNRHLPDIPSAAAMEENGVNLAEMNKLLLQKIEELTLYLIRQQAEIDELKTARYESNE